MIVLACDPGTTESSFVTFDGTRVLEAVEMPNTEAIDYIYETTGSTLNPVETFVVEWVESFGMSVGREVFETCFWVGRFAERALRNVAVKRVTRRQVKLNVCGSMKAKDANIRQALIDKLGPVGTKKHPGPLYGISAHKWSALAVAVTYAETQQEYRLEPSSAATKEF